MKPQLMDILCCPLCKGDLTLTVEAQADDEIQEATLTCRACQVDYPVTEGIPNLLPSTPA